MRQVGRPDSVDALADPDGERLREGKVVAEGTEALRQARMPVSRICDGIGRWPPASAVATLHAHGIATLSDITVRIPLRRQWQAANTGFGAGGARRIPRRKRLALYLQFARLDSTHGWRPTMSPPGRRRRGRTADGTHAVGCIVTPAFSACSVDWELMSQASAAALSEASMLPSGSLLPLPICEGLFSIRKAAAMRLARTGRRRQVRGL